MPLLVRGGGGGKSTKDATAVPGDVASGKSFYGVNGREIGTANIQKEVIFSIKHGEEFSKAQKQLTSAKIIHVLSGANYGGEEIHLNIQSTQESNYAMLMFLSAQNADFVPKVYKSILLNGLSDFVIEITDAKSTAKTFVIPQKKNFPNGTYLCKLLFKNVWTQFTWGYAYVYFKLTNKKIVELGIVGTEEKPSETQKFDMNSSGNELIFKIRRV